MTNTAKIKEMFVSIQGEGPYIGYNQLFIRFCNCNLKCNFCDTEFSANEKFEEHTPCSLLERIKDFDIENIHSISLTGGEPLLSTEFLKEFLPMLKNKVYLETNATLSDRLDLVKPYIDYISADIKLESATGIKDTFNFHDKFFEKCRGIETFAKIVFDKNITEEEIEKSCELGKKYDIEIILQPMMNGNSMTVTSEFIQKTYERFLKKYNKVRVIPQVHKFLGVE